MQLLVAAVQHNPQLQAVECSGNGASEDVMRELGRALAENRERERGKRVQSQPQESSPYTRTVPVGSRFLPAPPQYGRADVQQHIEEERRAVARHLEKLIERERGYGTQVREQLQDEVQRAKVRLAGNAQKVEALQRAIEEQRDMKAQLEMDVRDNTLRLFLKASPLGRGHH